MFLSDLAWIFYKYKGKLVGKGKWYSSGACLPLKVLFFGTDVFSLPSLQMLREETKLVSNLGVVTSMKGPGNCVREYAAKHCVPIFPWPLAPEQCTSFDLGIVVSFGYLIPKRVIESFSLGIINVHASLLPRWRGAAPIIYAIMNNDSVTGVSVMKIEPEFFDIGDILAQKSINIPPGIFMPELHKQLSYMGAELLHEVLNGYPYSFQNAKKQNNNLATYAPKITNTTIEIDWTILTANDIYTRYRALYGFKNLTTKFQKKVLYILDARLPQENVDIKYSSLTTHEPGQIWFKKSNNSLLVLCANNSFLEIHTLRLEGKKVMTALQFNNGYLCQMKISNIIFNR